MIAWIGKWLRLNRRATDLSVLWPACKVNARDLDHAKAAFMFHAANDDAWTKDFSHEELKQFVGSLD